MESIYFTPLFDAVEAHFFTAYFFLLDKFIPKTFLTGQTAGRAALGLSLSGLGKMIDLKTN